MKYESMMKSNWRYESMMPTLENVQSDTFCAFYTPINYHGWKYTRVRVPIKFIGNYQEIFYPPWD